MNRFIRSMLWPFVIAFWVVFLITIGMEEVIAAVAIVGMVGVAILLIRHAMTDYPHPVVTHYAEPPHEHIHRGDFWSGHEEWCECGASASERKDSTTGVAYYSFDEWE